MALLVAVVETSAEEITPHLAHLSVILYSGTVIWLKVKLTRCNIHKQKQMHLHIDSHEHTQAHTHIESQCSRSLSLRAIVHLLDGFGFTSVWLEEGDRGGGAKTDPTLGISYQM